ncbi:response regulator transcription factor [Peribacillus muralis]|uniref:response regulator transcription factor n=1 Tax=Peribacillus muralis TaxID=264697 RepID=UPI00381AA532
MFTILVVEDDKMIGSLLENILQKESYKVIWIENGASLYSVIKQVDFVIMDIMLPGEDGFQISVRINRLGLNIPIIFLTARSDIDSKLKGLEIGEDYMVKPFDPRELLIRIKNKLVASYGIYKQIQHLSIDDTHMRVVNSQNNKEVEFTAIEKKIFFYLYKNADFILSKEQFIEYLWQLEDRNPNLINVYIKKVRNKIDDADGVIIQNVYGEGYRMNTHVKQ